MLFIVYSQGPRDHKSRRVGLTHSSRSADRLAVYEAAKPGTVEVKVVCHDGDLRETLYCKRPA